MSANHTAKAVAGATAITHSGRSTMVRLLATLVLLYVASAASANNPLAPVDTSSPRSTLKSFLDLTDEATRLLSEYRRAPSSEIQARARSLGDKAAELLDLSQVPPVSRPEVADTTLYLLWDVIARVPLPMLNQVPGQPSDAADDQKDKLPVRWSIPGTDITIGRINEGPQAGEYLFTADTVQRARSFYDAARELPYQRPMPLGDVYRYSLTWTGWMIPAAWVEALPAWANSQILDQVLWKWLAMLLLIGFAVAIAIAVFRLLRRWSSGRTARAHLARMGTPVVIILLARLLMFLSSHQINATGPVVEALAYGVEVITAAAAVWILWHILGWVAEVIIASPRISPESLDAHLIRLAARTLGLVAMVVLIFRVLNELGVPVYGLVAGAGVGGLAVALAARSTLENFMGALNLFADRPVRIGDTCRYDEDQTGGWRPIGRVESIGLRSTKIRKFDRSLVTIPNADFAQRHIINTSSCDRFLLSATLGLRYETTDDQLRYLLGELRELLHAHPKTVHTNEDPLRARFVGFGDFSLNVALRAYIRTSSYSEFLAIQEDILLRIMKLVERAGTGFAFPSRTLYIARDGGLDGERQQAAEKQVREWAAAQTLPFPDVAEDYRKSITDTLDYPPAGSPGADLG